MSRKATIRRYTSLGHLEDAVFYALEQHFPERDIELFKQWHAGVPLTIITKNFDLKPRKVEQIIKDNSDHPEVVNLNRRGVINFTVPPRQ